MRIARDFLSQCSDNVPRVIPSDCLDNELNCISGLKNVDQSLAFVLHRKSLQVAARLTENPQVKALWESCPYVPKALATYERGDFFVRRRLKSILRFLSRRMGDSIGCSRKANLGNLNVEDASDKGLRR